MKYYKISCGSIDFCPFHRSKDIYKNSMKIEYFINDNNLWWWPVNYAYRDTVINHPFRIEEINFLYII